MRINRRPSDIVIVPEGDLTNSPSMYRDIAISGSYFPELRADKPRQCFMCFDSDLGGVATIGVADLPPIVGKRLLTFVEYRHYAMYLAAGWRVRVGRVIPMCLLGVGMEAVHFSWSVRGGSQPNDATIMMVVWACLALVVALTAIGSNSFRGSKRQVTNFVVRSTALLSALATCVLVLGSALFVVFASQRGTFTVSDMLTAQMLGAFPALFAVFTCIDWRCLSLAVFVDLIVVLVALLSNQKPSYPEWAALHVMAKLVILFLIWFVENHRRTAFAAQIRARILARKLEACLEDQNERERVSKAKKDTVAPSSPMTPQNTPLETRSRNAAMNLMDMT